MGNKCFPAKQQRIQRKFKEGAVLRPCKAHSKISEDIKAKWATSLTGPAHDCHLACLAALIEAGADVNEELRTGETPLHFHPLQHKLSYDNKTRDVHFQCIQLLVEKGADVNIRQQDGQLPLHKAAEANHANCVELFIKLGADVNTKANNGKTPLLTAVERGCYESIEKLIQMGADVNIGKSENCPPLFTLTTNGFHKCLKLMIQSGADVNFHQDNRNRTPLMEAAYRMDHKSVRILIDSGANVNSSTDTGLTALMFAACYNNEWVPGNFCTNYLLNAGAHVNKINSFGQNALQISVAWNTYCYWQEYYDNRSGKDAVMLLLAAGESIKGATVDRINFYGHCDRTIDIPAYLLEFRQIKLSLKWACREVIRKKLIQSDPHTNLFVRVPKLGLPKPLHLFLLYDIDLSV